MARKKKKTARDDELSGRPAISERLLDIFSDVEKGFADQSSRADDIVDYWDIYNCVLGERQFYNGNSTLFIPIVRNAVAARATRFVNQMFPQNGRNVEVTTSDADIPHATMALVEHYISRAKLRTQIMPALMRNGDVEGQYTVYVDWSKITRHVVSRQTKGVKIDGLEHPELHEFESIEEEKIVDAQPIVEVVSDCDFLVLPATVDSLDEALERGGSITIIRRWSKAQIKKMIADGDITAAAGDAVVANMGKKDTSERPDIKKELASTAGIKSGGGSKFCVGYETWTKIKVDGMLRLVRAYYGGDKQVMGCKLNPFWCDRSPIISGPVVKIPGVFKGMSMIQPGIMDLQIEANDAINQGADNLNYALNPVTLVDPEKVARWESLVLDLGAVWPVGPNGAKALQFPNVSEQAMATVMMCKNEIFQALGVNPSMVPGSTGGKSKRNQAEIANEQAVDVLTTADAVTNVEGEILTPLVQRFVEYDHQFREDDVLVRSFGELGLRAEMEEIPPIQMNRKWEMKWFGVEAARNAAMIQQKIAMANVFKGIPPQMYPGYTFSMAPLMVQMAEDAFGPRLAPLMFTPLKDQLSVEAEIENGMLSEGFDLMVHPPDNDIEHIQAHMPLIQGGDPHGTVRAHILKHQTQMQAKAMKQAEQEKGQTGSPGGAGPGVAGAPKPGGQVAGPRQMKQPNGAIHPDQMARAGAPGMPRKM